ncbi:MAG: MFS transporter [Candidatus Binatia bacterium]
MRGTRLLIMSVIWLAAFFLILDRVNISLAAPRIMDELHFDGTQMGFILSIYYWGYLLGHFSSGLVSDRIRLRSVTSWLMLSWSLLTALTGACVTLWHFSIVRLLFGITEGATANLHHKLQNNWLLPAERGRAYGIFIGFAYLGVSFGLPLVGWIINLWDWRMMFVIVGAMTLFMLALFAIVVRDHPHEHPWVTEHEKEEVRQALAQARASLGSHDETITALSLRQRFAQLSRITAFWLLSISAFFGIGVYFTAMSWFPGYLVKERGFTIMNSGMYLIIPYLAAFAGMYIGGGVGDRFGYRSLISLVTALLTLPALIGMALSTGVNTTILMMSIVLFLNAASVNGFVVLVFDLIPAELFGTAVGIVGGLCGGLGGIIGPLLLGYLYDTTGTFFWGFVALGVGTMIGGLVLLPVIGYERQIKREKIVGDGALSSPTVAVSQH